MERNKEEYIDIYDAQRNLTGKIIPRANAFLSEGEYMLYVLAIIQDAQGRYLITQRAWDKHWAPGSWEVPGGGVLAGETSMQAVVREVYEEVGLDISNQCRDPIYSYKNVDLERGDNYLVDIYYIQREVTQSDIVLQNSEAIAYMFAPWQKIIELAAQGRFLHFSRLKAALEK